MKINDVVRVYEKFLRDHGRDVKVMLQKSCIQSDGPVKALHEFRLRLWISENGHRFCIMDIFENVIMKDDDREKCYEPLYLKLVEEMFRSIYGQQVQ